MSPTILIVDDHQLYRSALRELLQTCWPNARIEEAADSGEALLRIPQYPWNVILLDYHLPTLSGGDLLRLLRARADARGIALPPIVLMSTQLDVGTFARACGAVAYLPKPVEEAELRAVLAPYIPITPFHCPNPSLIPPAAPPLRPLPSTTHQQAIAAPAGTIYRRITPRPTSRIVQVRDAIEDLVHATMRRFPPPYAPGEAPPSSGQIGRLGEYLVQFGYLTARQRTRALQLSQELPRGTQPPLGFTLAAQDLVPSSVLSVVLLHQFRDRLALDAPSAPRFVGEQLLIHALLTPAQLAQALHEQIERYQHGRWVRLGDVIVRHGWLDSTVIRAAVPDPLRSSRSQTIWRG